MESVIPSLLFPCGMGCTNCTAPHSMDMGPMWGFSAVPGSRTLHFPGRGEEQSSLLALWAAALLLSCTEKLRSGFQNSQIPFFGMDVILPDHQEHVENGSTGQTGDRTRGTLNVSGRKFLCATEEQMCYSVAITLVSMGNGSGIAVLPVPVVARLQTQKCPFSASPAVYPA